MPPRRGTKQIIHWVTGESREMSKTIHTDAVRDFFSAIRTLQTEEECFRFFEDVCTVNELLSISQRFEVARMLTQKKTYLEIAGQTGASTATISRVNRSLMYGNDGYTMVLERMDAAEGAAAEGADGPEGQEDA